MVNDCSFEPHIVHGVMSLDVGGLERLVLDLAKLHLRRGWRVTVICVERRGRLSDSIEAMGAEVISLDKPPGRQKSWIAKTRACLQSLAPEIVHTHQIGALCYLGQAARGMPGSRVVHTEHSDHVRHAKGVGSKLKNRLRWRAYGKWADRICCVSDDVAASMGRWGTVPPEKLTVVRNGIDMAVYEDTAQRLAIRAQLGIAQDAWVVGTVGRLHEVKQQDELIRAFAIAGREGSKFQEGTRSRLVVVGDGPERDRLERLAKDWAVADRTIFAGYQARPENFYAAMDLFALTSRHEGLPLSILEAWASGLPVVASAVGGIPKLVSDQQTGLLYPSGDVERLRDALDRFYSDSDFAQRIAAAGRCEVRQHYSLQQMAEQYEQCYRGEASSTGGHGALASAGVR